MYIVYHDIASELDTYPRDTVTAEGDDTVAFSMASRTSLMCCSEQYFFNQREKSIVNMCTIL